MRSKRKLKNSSDFKTFFFLFLGLNLFFSDKRVGEYQPEIVSLTKEKNNPDMSLSFSNVSSDDSNVTRNQLGRLSLMHKTRLIDERSHVRKAAVS